MFTGELAECLMYRVPLTRNELKTAYYQFRKKWRMLWYQRARDWLFH